MTTDKRALFRKIAEQYSIGPVRDGKPSVSWVTAFRDHPDWAKALDCDMSKKSLNRVMASGRYYAIQEGRKTGSVRGEPKPEAPVVETNGPVREVALEPDLPSLSFCPQCGLNLSMFERAVRIAAKHGRK